MIQWRLSRCVLRNECAHSQFVWCLSAAETVRCKLFILAVSSLHSRWNSQSHTYVISVYKYAGVYMCFNNYMRWVDVLLSPYQIDGLTCSRDTAWLLCPYGVCVQDKDFNDPIQLFSFSRWLYKLVGFVVAFSYIRVILCSYLFSPHCTCWSSSPSQISPPLCFHAICILFLPLYPSPPPL